MGRRQAPIGWHLPEFRPLARPLARPPLRGGVLGNAYGWAPLLECGYRCRYHLAGNTALQGHLAPPGRGGRGRDRDCSPPPAQIPAGAVNAPGSHLGW